jgi:2-succinyl-5-enolpyruvyl-6-hydroxy-3-cyclohexene-1-carboxylate synthase
MSVFGDFMTSQAVKSDEEILTLRAEVERLTNLIEQVKQEITEEPTIGRTVDILFREPLEKAEAENRGLTATVARLTGERDAARTQASQAQQALRERMEALEQARAQFAASGLTSKAAGCSRAITELAGISKILAKPEAALPSDTQGAAK